MKYRNRVRKVVYFEATDFKLYEKAALDARPNVDFSAWVNAQCRKACKADARKINNRNNKGE